MQKTVSKPIVKRRTQKPPKASHLAYRRVMAAAKALPIDQQIDLLDELSAETQEARRERFIAEVKEAEEQIKRGEYITGTVEEIMRELHK